MTLSGKLEEAIHGGEEQETLDELFEVDASEFEPIEERSGEDAITVARRIVKNHQWEKIQGAAVDAWTASAIIGVYDALNEKNKASFRKMPIRKMAEVAIRLAKMSGVKSRGL